MTLRAIAVWALLVSSAAAAENALWLDVPFVRQQKNGCGAASSAMIVEYWRLHGYGREGDPLGVPAEGVSPRELQSYFEGLGFRAYTFAGEWDDLEHHLSQGRPLIVALGAARLRHYVVVAGIDSARGLILVNDPAQRKLLTTARRSFEREWNGSGRWALVAVPAP